MTLVRTQQCFSCYTSGKINSLIMFGFAVKIATIKTNDIPYVMKDRKCRKLLAKYDIWFRNGIETFKICQWLV